MGTVSLNFEHGNLASVVRGDKHLFNTGSPSPSFINHTAYFNPTSYDYGSWTWATRP